MKQSVRQVLKLTAYINTDYTGQASHRKPLRAAAIHSYGQLIDWYCIKQINVPLLTMETEFVSSRCYKSYWDVTSSYESAYACQHE